MSTNFHIVTGNEEIHIGKRSAAGLYCYKCRQTTCYGGALAIYLGGDFAFSKTCPKCRMPVNTATCSFTWAMEPHKLAFALYHDDAAVIFNEYGEVYPANEFYAMIEHKCKIQFYDSIGTEFC